ncbi:MAG: hypothetical protein AAGB26_08150 [Planctomycetota bacterium]
MPTVQTQPHLQRAGYSVSYTGSQPIIVNVLVETMNALPILDEDRIHDCLLDAWQQASGWCVGRYAMLPDQVQLLAAQQDFACDLGDWVQYWKARVKSCIEYAGFEWQPRFGSATVTTPVNYKLRRESIRLSPVSHKVVRSVVDWPYAGVVEALEWD